MSAGTLTSSVRAGVGSSAIETAVHPSRDRSAKVFQDSPALGNAGESMYGRLFRPSLRENRGLVAPQNMSERGPFPIARRGPSAHNVAETTFREAGIPSNLSLAHS